MTKHILGSMYLLGLVSYLAKFSEKWKVAHMLSIAQKALRSPYRGFQAQSGRKYQLASKVGCVSKRDYMRKGTLIGMSLCVSL